MATRDYWAWYFNGTTSVTGLAPTFIVFINGSGSGIVAPAVTEPASKGLYKFAYDATQTISFILDGATTGLASNQRYISGVVEAQDTFGVTLNAVSATLAGMGNTLGAMGTTLVGIGNTAGAVGASQIAQGQTLAGIALAIGSTASSFGSTSVDPVDLFAFLKRAQEFWEGNQTYTKATGIMDFYSRGSSTLLREKTISDTTNSTTKT